jgi:Zn-finger nucleic acid-binding protein
MGCADCEGAFISHETFELIQERALKTAPVASRSASRAGVNTLDAEVKYLRCPECRTFMNRLNFANKSGVLIDNCREHGVWTDPGELDGILDFIARGGLRDQPMEPLIGVHQRRDYGEEHSLSVGRPAGAGGEFPVGRNPPDERIQRSDDSPLDEFIRVIHRLLR